MQLYAACYYRSKSEEWNDKWRNEDFAARNLVKAVKRETFGGNSEITVGQRHRFQIINSPQGQAQGMACASLLLAIKLHNANLRDVAIVPVPSSSRTTPHMEFTGGRLAAGIAHHLPQSEAVPALYFSQPVPKSSAGGGRNEGLIYSRLRAQNLGQPRRVVLLDDVYTTGAHVRAAARFLREQGFNVENVIVVGRTAWRRPARMLTFQPETI